MRYLNLWMVLIFFIFITYQDIIDILKEDNFLKEIPMIQRKIMELDIEAISTNQKEFIDLEFKVVALNTIRYIIEDNNILSSDTFKQKYKNNYQKVLEYFIEVMKPT